MAPTPKCWRPAECLRLLAGERLGRVAITVKALPVILPVRFALDRDEIVFRAPPGGVLAEATRHAVIAFEADGSEPGGGSWSVLATGLARHLAERRCAGADLAATVVVRVRRVRRLDPPAALGSAAERHAARTAHLPDRPAACMRPVRPAAQRAVRWAGRRPERPDPGWPARRAPDGGSGG